MYVILVDYTSRSENIDSAPDTHKIWLNENYAAGRFLASRRREPRTGGVILAANHPREEIEAAVAKDPFALRGSAKHAIVEFRPSRMTGDSLAKLFGD